MPDTIEIIDLQTLSHNWGCLTNTVFKFKRSDGTWQTNEREVYDHGHAASALLYDPMRNCITLVRQFRLPVHLNAPSGWLLETCAGLLDGDNPETCARREAKEETGVDVIDLTSIGHAFASPGSYTEIVHGFIGTYKGPPPVTHAGLAEEGEYIEVVEMAFAKALEMVTQGEITDMKTIWLIQALALRKLT